jgi:hypothetical protein
MPDDPCSLIFFISENRTAIEASWIDAMVASSSDGLLVRGMGRSAVQQANGAPGFVLIQPVERMTGTHASLAPGTQIEVHLEGVLLARARMFQRNQITIDRRLAITLRAVALSEPFDRRELLLLGEQFVDEGRPAHSSFEKMACSVLRSFRRVNC